MVASSSAFREILQERRGWLFNAAILSAVSASARLFGRIVDERHHHRSLYPAAKSARSPRALPCGPPVLLGA